MSRGIVYFLLCFKTSKLVTLAGYSGIFVCTIVMPPNSYEYLGWTALHGPRQEHGGGGRAPGVHAHQNEAPPDQVP
jgi:hypothetical protein